MPAVSTVTCADWRDLSESETRPLLEREAAVWRQDLLWDVRNSWRVIEPARAAGALPGVVARDESGRIAGWTWFLNHRGCLQVAAVVAADAGVTAALVDAVRNSEAARTSTRQVWSIPGETPGLRNVLINAGLRVERYLYLRVALDRSTIGANESVPQPPRGWTGADLRGVAGLLARAYAGAGTVRAFAPENTTEAWEDYLRTLINTDGCGTVLPEATLIHESSGTIRGAIICAAINDDPRVAHISQVAVDPLERRTGIARRLVQSAMARCESAGFTSLTLLVAEPNTAGRRLYDSLGFSEVAQFTVASS